MTAPRPLTARRLAQIALYVTACTGFVLGLLDVLPHPAGL